jgi:hypothetical protein
MMAPASIWREAMAQTTAPPRPAAQVHRGPGYDEDFVLWAQHQAELMRAGGFDLVDWENVAEEIEGLGQSDLQQLGNRLDVLITHLLKWQFQPPARSGSWRGTIRTQRGRIVRLLKQSPSLRQHVGIEAQEGYGRARATAADEAGLPPAQLPSTCPYSVEELLDENFFPGPIDET